MIHAVHIPQWHPATVNQLMGSWRKAWKLKKSDKAIISYHLKKLPKAEGRRCVGLTIVLKKGQRAADPDAYYKSLLDALVHAKMLKNDNRFWVELAPVQFERGTESRWGTYIILEDLPQVKILPAKHAQGSLPDHRIRPTGSRKVKDEVTV